MGNKGTTTRLSAVTPLLRGYGTPSGVVGTSTRRGSRAQRPAAEEARVELLEPRASLGPLLLTGNEGRNQRAARPSGAGPGSVLRGYREKERKHHTPHPRRHRAPRGGRGRDRFDPGGGSPGARARRARGSRGLSTGAGDPAAPGHRGRAASTATSRRGAAADTMGGPGDRERDRPERHQLPGEAAQSGHDPLEPSGRPVPHRADQPHHRRASSAPAGGNHHPGSSHAGPAALRPGRRRTRREWGARRGHPRSHLWRQHEGRTDRRGCRSGCRSARFGRGEASRISCWRWAPRSPAFWSSP